MTKKLLALLLAAAMILGLAACGSGSGGSTTSDNAPAASTADSAAAPAAVSIQSTEASLLQGTQERLEADLCAECERRFGAKVKLEITLTRTEQTVRAEKVLVILPAACTSAEQSRIAAYLQQELGMAPILEVQEGTE